MLSNLHKNPPTLCLYIMFIKYEIQGTFILAPQNACVKLFFVKAIETMNS